MTPSAVRRLQAGADLQHDVDAFRGRELALPQQDGAQVLTLDELHGDELDAVGFVQVVDADDVLVRDLAGQHQFLLEARQDGRIAGKVGTNDLQPDDAFHFHVAGFVDCAHAAHAEHLVDLVAAAEDISFAEDGCADVGENRIQLRA